MMRANKIWTAAMMALAAGLPFEAMAGAPKDWQLGFIPPASPNMQSIYDLNEWLFWIITLIAAFVLVLLVYAMVRFSEGRNPNPSQRSHNTLIEVIWTVVPVIILVGIAIPSFKQLYFLGRTPTDVGLTIKAIGKQWYWSYEYPDHAGVAFDAFMVPDDSVDKSKGQLRLLETDNIVYVPVDTNVRVLVTADDVIHAWAVPALGVKKDGVPGRTNETWFRATKTGSYYGQCSELCGVNHGFMPIRIEVVSKEDFDKWIAEKKTAAAASATKLAQASVR
jgi:cytochrome c oxidase subunit 2